MFRNRVIPLLLIQDRGLVKTVKFKNPKYIGDPVNTLQIFNEKEVDEIIVLDIDASHNGEGPNFDLISEIAGECFMPLCYGGGISCLDDAKRIFDSGIEKVSINFSAQITPSLITDIADIYGSQAVIVSLDCQRSIFGHYRVHTRVKARKTDMSIVEYAKSVENAGAGEILLTSVDRDGVMEGYDINLIKNIVKEVTIPVIASGGAGKFSDLVSAINEGGASAVSAGSMFIYHGKHKAVLVNYPFEQLLGNPFC